MKITVSHCIDLNLMEKVDSEQFAQGRSSRSNMLEFMITEYFRLTENQDQK